MRGLTNLAENTITSSADSTGDAESPYASCIRTLTNAMITLHKGDAHSAGNMLSEYAEECSPVVGGQASSKNNCWSKIRADAGRAAADEAYALTKIVCGEVAWQRADGVSTVRHVVASLHALMSAARHKHMIQTQKADSPISRTNSASSSTENCDKNMNTQRNGTASSSINSSDVAGGNVAEGQDSAAVQGGEDVFALAAGVCGKAVDVTHWRVLCEVARGLLRAGDVMVDMGRSREAEYYYMQVSFSLVRCVTVPCLSVCLSFCLSVFPVSQSVALLRPPPPSCVSIVMLSFIQGLELAKGCKSGHITPLAYISIVILFFIQGLELAKGCKSACWRIRFTLGLASLRLAQVCMRAINRSRSFPLQYCRPCYLSLSLFFSLTLSHAYINAYIHTYTNRTD